MKSVMGGRSYPRQRRRCIRYALQTLSFLAFLASLLATYLVYGKTYTIVRRKEAHDGFTELLSTSLGRQAALPTNVVCRYDLCCALWQVDTDAWWLNHSEYKLASENETHTCFERISDPGHASFVRQLHHVQWSENCSNDLQSVQISSGYAAALQSVTRSFYASFQQGRPFTINKRHVNGTWNFSPRHSTHWAFCDSQDMNCYFLPISPCAPELGRNDAPRGSKPTQPGQRREFGWLRQYAFRPRHVLRRKLFEYRQRVQPTKMRTPCIAIHVRRGDISFGKGRRYVPVDEYLQAARATKGDTVVVLTDDRSTIDEINNYLRDDYNWVYLERPRTQGTELGFEGFLPSHDPAAEILAIQAEVQLAAQCHTLVHGKSGFVAVIEDALRTSGHDYRMIYLDNQLDKSNQPKLEPEQRAKHYLQAIREHYKRRHWDV